MLDIEGIIEYGELHRYYRFSIESPYSANQIDNFLANGNLSLNYFKQNAKKELNELQALIREICSDETISGAKDICKEVDLSSFCWNEDRVINTDQAPLDSGSLPIESLTLNYFINIETAITDENKLFTRQCGSWTNENISRFILIPAVASFRNKIASYVTLSALLLSNGMGFIKVEVPFSQINYQDLCQGNLDAQIQEVRLLGTNKERAFCSIASMVDYLLGCISSSCSVDIRIPETPFDNMILMSYSGQCDTPAQMSDLTKEIMFRIVCFPEPNNPLGYYKSRSSDLFLTHTIDYKDVLCILSPTGNCLTLISKRALTEISSGNIEDLGSKIHNASLAYQPLIYSSRIINSQFELSIIISGLKKTMNEVFIGESLANPSKLKEAKTRNLANRVFIIEMQGHCFGTVSEQIDFFETAMPYYFKEQAAASKAKAFEEIIEIQNEKQRSRFNIFISSATLIFAAVFALPSIHDTYELLRTIIPFDDIPFITLDCVSFLTWLITIGGLLALTVRLNKKQKTKPITAKDEKGNTIPIGQY